MKKHRIACCGLALLAAAAAFPQPRTLTLREAVNLALRQSPDVLLSQLDQQQAAARVRMAEDPFYPKVFAGSGLAYSSGFPMSIEGSAPSIMQARAVASVYDRQKKLQLAQTREEQRSVGLGAEEKREQAIYRVVEIFLDAERKQRLAGIATRQVESAAKLQAVVKARVQEGRELPIELTRAELELAKARQRTDGLVADVDYAEGSLAMVLGLEPGQRARPATEDRMAPLIPVSAEAAVTQALADNREIRRLQSSLLAKNLEVKSNQASRYPRLDLVAQYGLFAKFNNYEDFFQKFQRHNGQIGVALEIPVLAGPGRGAAVSSSQAEAARLQVQMNTARSRISLEAGKSFQDLTRAESARQVARLDLDLARENLTMLLALLEEGRASLQQVEQARVAESEKWMLYFDAQHHVELASFQLLDRTGGLLAALR
ncbi:MAG: TolC family protein [Acidobacteriia bacterium]|nr:TolC family protein [Terriglobia bacterium]